MRKRFAGAQPEGEPPPKRVHSSQETSIDECSDDVKGDHRDTPKADACDVNAASDDGTEAGSRLLRLKLDPKLRHERRFLQAMRSATGWLFPTEICMLMYGFIEPAVFFDLAWQYQWYPRSVLSDDSKHRFRAVLTATPGPLSAADTAEALLFVFVIDMLQPQTALDTSLAMFSDFVLSIRNRCAEPKVRIVVLAAYETDTARICGPVSADRDDDINSMSTAVRNLQSMPPQGTPSDHTNARFGDDVLSVLNSFNSDTNGVKSMAQIVVHTTVSSRRFESILESLPNMKNVMGMTEARVELHVGGGSHGLIHSWFAPFQRPPLYTEGVIDRLHFGLSVPRFRMHGSRSVRYAQNAATDRVVQRFLRSVASKLTVFCSNMRDTSMRLVRWHTHFDPVCSQSNYVYAAEPVRVVRTAPSGARARCMRAYLEVTLSPPGCLSVHTDIGSDEDQEDLADIPSPKLPPDVENKDPTKFDMGQESDDEFEESFENPNTPPTTSSTPSSTSSSSSSSSSSSRSISTTSPSSISTTDFRAKGRMAVAVGPRGDVGDVGDVGDSSMPSSFNTRVSHGDVNVVSTVNAVTDAKFPCARILVCVFDWRTGTAEEEDLVFPLPLAPLVPSGAPPLDPDYCRIRMASEVRDAIRRSSIVIRSKRLHVERDVTPIKHHLKLVQKRSRMLGERAVADFTSKLFAAWSSIANPR